MIKKVIQPEATSFRPVPKKNAANEPNATLNALFLSEPSFNSSPTKAPKNGPRIIPHGMKNNTYH